MIETEHPHHHASHTGHRWLDISLALSAMFVSVISLVVAVEHGHTMERMAEANARMVQANSWPFIQFDTHNLDERGNEKVRLVVTNQGVGPARIETFELWWKGQPMSSPRALMEACCTGPALASQWKGTVTSSDFALPGILRTGDHQDVFAILPNSSNADLLDRFDHERDNITVRVCYCSVFDECWRGSGTSTKAEQVASCPTPAVPFNLNGNPSQPDVARTPE